MVTHKHTHNEFLGHSRAVTRLSHTNACCCSESCTTKPILYSGRMLYHFSIVYNGPKAVPHEVVERLLPMILVVNKGRGLSDDANNICCAVRPIKTK